MIFMISEKSRTISEVVTLKRNGKFVVQNQFRQFYSVLEINFSKHPAVITAMYSVSLHFGSEM